MFSVLHPSSPELSPSAYLAHDTIAALSSAVGGAIAIVRLSGPRTREILLHLCPEFTLTPRQSARAALRAQNGALLDDAVVIFYANPASFTGEDVAELFVHGGAFVASRVLEELLVLGARQALPGEFSFRAVRNGKLSLSQATAIPDLISAQNEGAVQLALDKLSGQQNAQLQELARELVSLASMSELGIDFSDQNVPEVSLPALKEGATHIRSVLAALEVGFDRGSRIQEGIRVAIVGQPNAGKSSFFNALLGEDRSIVSDIAGTTRDTVRETLSLRTATGGATFRIEDTAGLRKSQDQIEQLGMERSRSAAQKADLVLFLIAPGDPAHGLAAQALFKDLGIPAQKALILLTQSDRLDAESQTRWLKQAHEAFASSPIFLCNVRNSDGLRSALQGLLDASQRFLSRQPGEILLTRLDQLRAVQTAQSHIDRALGVTEEDLFAADIRQALSALEPLLGQTSTDAILGKIFSDFCIGK